MFVAFTILAPALTFIGLEFWAWRYVPPKWFDGEDLLVQDPFETGRALKKAGLLRELRIYRLVRYVVAPVLLVVGLVMTILFETR